MLNYVLTESKKKNHMHKLHNTSSSSDQLICFIKVSVKKKIIIMIIIIIIIIKMTIISKIKCEGK